MTTKETASNLVEKYMIIFFMLFCSVCRGQNYKKVDTVYQFKDAEVIIVGNKRDTIYYAKMKRGYKH